ncbi:MAG: NFACT RNA binding domain-containing protein [Erysipelotrichaceae bacterium]
MAIDGIIVHQICKDLTKYLPLKINKITQPSNMEVIFHARGSLGSHQLLISTTSNYNRINITNLSYINPYTPSNFLMILRKYIENGVLLDIKQYDLDRVVCLTIKNFNDFKDENIYYLYIELMGKYSNIILVNQQGIIIDALKRIPPSEKRVVHPGARFEYNEKVDKKNPFINFDVDYNLSLSAQFEGFSSLLCKEMEYRLHNQEIFSDVMEEINSSNQLFSYPNGVFHCLELKHLGQEYVAYEINKGFDNIYGDLLQQVAITQHTNDLCKFVRRELKKLRNKLPKLQISYQEYLNFDQYREIGDIIFCNLDKNVRGLDEIELYDFDDNLVKIKLDARFDLKGNGNKYYSKYQKAKKGLTYLQEQIDICQGQIAYFENIEFQLSQANVNTANEIYEELVNQNLLQAKKKNGSNKKKIKTLAYDVFDFGGHKVYVGHNNIQNEYLTWKLAKKDYYWFHVKDFHGAHVIVDSDQLDEQTIRFCANAAAYYSSGRDSSSVGVDYTLVKNLKKIKGSKFGMVSMSSYKTIYIDPIKVFGNV